MTWDAYIERLNTGLDLEPSQAQAVMREILEGNAQIESIKTFLLALKEKGESAE